MTFIQYALVYKRKAARVGSGKITLDLLNCTVRDPTISAVWKLDDRPQGRMPIRHGDFKRTCANIRAQLDKLNAYVMRNEALYNDLDAAEAVDPRFAEYNELLKDLRSYGATLYAYLVGDNENVANFLRETGRCSELLINYQDEEVMAPIGFACENDEHRRSRDPRLPTSRTFGFTSTQL